MSTTYTTLVSDIKAYAENDGSEFAAAVDGFIAKAENQLNIDLPIANQWAHKTTSMTDTERFLSKPPEAIQTRSLSIFTAAGRRIFLEKRSIEFCQVYAHADHDTGRPKYYAEWDDNDYLIAPTPDAAYTTEATYKVRVTALSSSNQSNFYSTYHSDLLFHLCMYYAESFNKNHAAAQKWLGVEGGSGYKDLLVGAKRDVALFFADEFGTGPLVN